jgi:hypothetical protein
VYAEEGPVRGYARAVVREVRDSSQDDDQCDRNDLPPVKKEVCAALRIILEEALIVDGGVLSTRLKTESCNSDRQKS